MIGTPRPEAYRKLKQFPIFENKWLILTIFVILLLVIFVISSKFTNAGTGLEITPIGNKFRLNFQIPKNDQENFSRTLSQLNLPQEVKEGVEFELDATSSAALAFASPINAKLNFKTKQVKIKGLTNSTSPVLFLPESFKLPQSTKLAIFAPDIKNFLDSQVNIPPELTSFINNLFSQRGQLLAFYNDNDFLMITKANQVNFDDLSNLKIPKEEEFYKREQIEESFETHLLKLPQKTESQKSTLSIFQLGQWIFIASSQEAARKFIQVQKFEKGAIEFPKSKQATLVVLIKNPDIDTASSLGQILLSSKKDWLNIFSNIQELEFVLKGNVFSGLINLK
ncbi:hypothetical protein A3D81_00045 [Candidatus Curtissbacteria bacterium RIFCSPHIGHO2_02_FULL_40_17]|uniref:Uncharacterized protein n=4 Tax=Candidatus Curtissiibacteriota TaxID=1752717 RepID=A0A1F5GGP4_9BACT|nr:MAG: hypothetical protein A2693_00710 [Candidatus Curtissbacteria bacterium RIFCSPHIGHO2_01_FULL_40_12]OGD90977.1 MAG: hypothetical protein A3D81_00045 [Candidatus Curtissbacteria bacterium RIFCSPHIGHO2_02_FULL_40_17]OGE05169.1 MAG: hypothetical protein A3F45_01700 [Candidatus Curtissbacteria bacterium RIFCSPHIGHO2_12_FULL_41_17]OGE07769.1 MAG: hypothetical protein A3I53_02110 [Candidatus Curtissbacteria bacterium RIFCSPLOWO2_02_FULL_40_13b]